MANFYRATRAENAQDSSANLGPVRVVNTGDHSLRVSYVPATVLDADFL